MSRKEDEPKEKKGEEIELVPLGFESPPDFVKSSMEDIETWVNKMPEDLRGPLMEKIKDLRSENLGDQD